MQTQYGFKRGTGTRDAIFIVRRIIDQCMMGKEQQMIFLALDWAKAFDAITPACLIQALRRFGIPEHTANIVNAIYSHRLFYVADRDSESKLHQQASGISQGCPLSPFLFVIMMSVLMSDAKESLQSKHNIQLSPNLVCHEVLYADDTLLIDIHGSNLQLYMQCIAEEGKSYGLSLNVSKLECMPVRCQTYLIAEDGSQIIVIVLLVSAIAVLLCLLLSPVSYHRIVSHVA